MSQPSSKPSHTGHLVPESPTHFYHCIPGLFGKPIGVLSLLSSASSHLDSSFHLHLGPNGNISLAYTHKHKCAPQNTSEYLCKCTLYLLHSSILHTHAHTPMFILQCRTKKGLHLNHKPYCNSNPKV